MRGGASEPPARVVPSGRAGVSGCESPSEADSRASVSVNSTAARTSAHVDAVKDRVAVLEPCRTTSSASAPVGDVVARTSTSMQSASPR